MMWWAALFHEVAVCDWHPRCGQSGASSWGNDGRPVGLAACMIQPRQSGTLWGHPVMDDIMPEEPTTTQVFRGSLHYSQIASCIPEALPSWNRRAAGLLLVMIVKKLRHWNCLWRPSGG